MATILVVDDELGIRALLTEILSDEGHTVEAAEDAAHARVLREKLQPDLVLLDIWMPDVDGITLLKEWNSTGQLTMPVIMMSGHGTIDTAVEAMKFGAAAFLEKPVTLQKLLRAVQNGLTRPAQKPAGVPAPAAGTPAAAAPRDTGPASVMPAPAAGAVEPPAPFGEPVAAPVAVTPAIPDSPAARLLLRELPLDAPLRDARDAFERAYFEHHLMREQGSMTRVAERTGLERTHLYRKLKQLGVDLTRGRRGNA